LLNATIVCLIEHGYAGVTTRLVADRAGLSQGALQGQFKTKAQLVAAAVRYLEEQLLGELAAIPRSTTDADASVTAGELLDRLWELHRGPLFLALLELLVAARTEPMLAEAVDELTRSMTAHYAAAAEALTPGASTHPAFRTWLMQAIVTIQGLALRTLTPRLDKDRGWPPLRNALLQSLHTVLGG
jgi:AcrR family transcriptional regulator